MRPKNRRYPVSEEPLSIAIHIFRYFNL